MWGDLRLRPRQPPCVTASVVCVGTLSDLIELPGGVFEMGSQQFYPDEGPIYHRHVIIFVLLAASTVLVPVIGYLIASARLAAPLDGVREWLVENNATIMTVVLLVIGVSVIGEGIGHF